MQGESSPGEEPATASETVVAARLEAATTLIGDDDEPPASASEDGAAVHGNSSPAPPRTAIPPPAPAKPPPPLRIVLVCRPRPQEEGIAPTYDGTISADRGKDAAYDPYWRSFEALDLHSVLDEAAEVVAAAEEKWLSDPLYPRVTAQPGKAPAKPATGGKSKPAPAKQPPAAPTAILPPVAPVSPGTPGPVSRPELPATATSQVQRVAETSPQDAEPDGNGQHAAPTVGAPLLPIGNATAGAKKVGDRKQLSLFG